MLKLWRAGCFFEARRRLGRNFSTKSGFPPQAAEFQDVFLRLPLKKYLSFMFATISTINSAKTVPIIIKPLISI
jgi:hypothetical protein